MMPYARYPPASVLVIRMTPFFTPAMIAYSVDAYGAAATALTALS